MPVRTSPAMFVAGNERDGQVNGVICRNPCDPADCAVADMLSREMAVHCHPRIAGHTMPRPNVVFLPSQRPAKQCPVQFYRPVRHAVLL